MYYNYKYGRRKMRRGQNLRAGGNQVWCLQCRLEMSVVMAPSLQKKGGDLERRSRVAESYNRFKPEQDDRWLGTEDQNTNCHVVRE
jgi:hypothetical protein